MPAFTAWSLNQVQDDEGWVWESLCPLRLSLRHHFLLSYSPQNVPASSHARDSPPLLHPRHSPFPTNRSFQGADALNFLHFRTFGGQKKRPGVATRPQFPACGLNHLVAIMIRLERAFAANADISGLLWR